MTSFPDTRGNEIIVILTCLCSWLMIARTMRVKARENPSTWVTILCCFAVFLYAIYVALAWHPEYAHCTKHCFPWGD
jgi:hypothetical protein